MERSEWLGASALRIETGPREGPLDDIADGNIVTPSCGSSPIAGIDEAFDLLRLKELRQGRLLPVCYLG